MVDFSVLTLFCYVKENVHALNDAIDAYTTNADHFRLRVCFDYSDRLVN